MGGQKSVIAPKIKYINRNITPEEITIRQNLVACFALDVTVGKPLAVVLTN